MATQNDRLPYAPGKRQPKKRVRPTSDALKAAAERLDLVNGKIGGYRAPAFIDLVSGDEGEDLTMYEKDAAHKRDRGNAKNTPLIPWSPAGGKKTRQRPLVLDSDDEEEDYPTVRSLRSATHRREGRDNIAPHNKRSHTRTDRYDLSLDGADERPEKTACNKHNDLVADIEDLDIDMEGWSDVELPGRSTRQTRSSQRQRKDEDEGMNTDESDTPPQPRRNNRARIPSSSPEPEGQDPDKSTLHASESEDEPKERRRRAHIVPSRPARDGRRLAQNATEHRKESESDSPPVQPRRRERARAPSISVDSIRRPATRAGGTGHQHLRRSTGGNATSISHAATSFARQPKRQRYAALSPSPIREVRDRRTGRPLVQPTSDEIKDFIYNGMIPRRNQRTKRTLSIKGYNHACATLTMPFIDAVTCRGQVWKTRTPDRVGRRGGASVRPKQSW